MKRFMLSMLFIQVALTAAPRVTVVVVVDQMAAHYLPLLKQWSTDGLATLLQQSCAYTAAYHPHGCPSTAPGHATIATGATARQHGVILNTWYDEQGTKVSFGAWPENVHTLLKAETLSDTLVDAGHAVFSLSYKARAALAMAGQKGTAVWFDAAQKRLVNNKERPLWLAQANKQFHAKRLATIDWPLRFKDANHPAYAYPSIDDRRYASIKTALAGKRFATQQSLLQSDNDDDSEPDDREQLLWLKTPAANKALIDTACTCIQSHMHRKPEQPLMVWLSLSSLDMLGHDYGPQSREVLDMLYWLDLQLGALLRTVQRLVGKQESLVVLTADHGVTPIPELSAQRGYFGAARVACKPLVKKLNKLLAAQFGHRKLVLGYKANQFFLNQQILGGMDPVQADEVLQACVAFLRAQPGMAHVWTRQEIEQATAQCHGPNDWLALHAAQYYPGHTGHIICQVKPLSVLTSYGQGTGHRSPYDSDRRVPLFFYGASLPRVCIHRSVCMTQLAATLATLLGVQKPASCVASPLQELVFKKQEQES